MTAEQSAITILSFALLYNWLRAFYFRRQRNKWRGLYFKAGEKLGEVQAEVVQARRDEILTRAKTRLVNEEWADVIE